MNKVDEKIEELLSCGLLKRDDPKFDFFKCRVVPAIVNEYTTSKGIPTECYKCPFEKCAVFVSKSCILESHLRDKHYRELPDGVFGNIIKCNVCQRNFVCRAHLNRHLEGKSHLKTLVNEGLANEDQKKIWESICQTKKQKSKEPIFTKQSYNLQLEEMPYHEASVLFSDSSDLCLSTPSETSSNELSFFSTPSSSDESDLSERLSSLNPPQLSEKSCQSTFVSCKSTSAQIDQPCTSKSLDSRRTQTNEASTQTEQLSLEETSTDFTRFEEDTVLMGRRSFINFLTSVELKTSECDYVYRHVVVKRKSLDTSEKLIESESPQTNLESTPKLLIKAQKDSDKGESQARKSFLHESEGKKRKLSSESDSEEFEFLSSQPTTSSSVKNIKKATKRVSFAQSSDKVKSDKSPLEEHVSHTSTPRYKLRKRKVVEKQDDSTSSDDSNDDSAKKQLKYSFD